MEINLSEEAMSLLKAAVNNYTPIDSNEEGVKEDMQNLFNEVG